jgi:hypothetical protein
MCRGGQQAARTQIATRGIPSCAHESVAAESVAEATTRLMSLKRRGKHIRDAGSSPAASLRGRPLSDRPAAALQA